SRLPEMFHPKCPATVPMYGAEPGEGSWMAIEHRHDPAMRWHSGQEPLDMAARIAETGLARPLRSRPACMQPVGGGYRQQADVAAILAHHADRLDSFRREDARIGDDHLRVRSGLAYPIPAMNDVLLKLWRHDALRLLDGAGG